jgi:hypothetical protein
MGWGVRSKKLYKKNTLKYCVDCAASIGTDTKLSINGCSKEISVRKNGRFKLLSYQKKKYHVKPLAYAITPKKPKGMWVSSCNGASVNYRLDVSGYSQNFPVYRKRPKFIEFKQSEVDYCILPQSLLEKILDMDLNEYLVHIDENSTEETQWACIFVEDRHTGDHGVSEDAAARYLDLHPNQNYIRVELGPTYKNGRTFACSTPRWNTGDRREKKKKKKGVSLDFSL